MTVRLYQRAYDCAKERVLAGAYVRDERDHWSEHQLTSNEENNFLARHGFGAYGRWFLGIDDEFDEDTKRRYTFPYGDFERVHRCGVLAAESRAGQDDYDEVQAATAHLHGMLEASSEEPDQ